MSEFFWGVATSAYQTEGGYNGPGEPRTNWAAAEARGDVATVGTAADFWHRYEEDFARCRTLGLNAFRLGIEWSRVQPVTSSSFSSSSSSSLRTGFGEKDEDEENDEGSGAQPFDLTALDGYAAMIAACQRHGLEPIVTLHHFVHPAWLGSDPWLDAKTPALFAAYVRLAVRHVNERLDRPIRWFITINEPNMLVLNSYLGRQFPAGKPRGFGPMIAAYNQLLRAHVLAYNALHDLYAERGWPEPRVTFNNYCSDLYWSDKLLLDLVCVRERGIAREAVGAHIVERAREFERAFANARLPLRKDFAFYLGSGLKRLSNWLGFRRFDAAQFAPLLDAIYTSPRARLLDYIGLDYYDPFAAHAFRLPVLWDHEFANRSFRAWMLATITSKWWDWRVLPRGLHFFCQHYAADFARPVLIAENGLALRHRVENGGSPRARRDSMTRSQFLRLHIHEVEKIVRDGVPLIGYLHWSLVDNYEWGTYTPRFGLYSIDYPRTTERSVTDPTGDRPAETYAELIREAGF